MEIVLIIALLAAERLRLDLPLRRWVARLLPRPAFAGHRTVPVPLALAGFDVRRLGPRLITVLVALLIARALLSGRPQHAETGVNQSVGFYWAMLGLVVLLLVATVGGRDRAQEVLAALPSEGRTRVRGWVVTLLLVALVVYALSALRLSRLTGGSYDALLPDAWELAQPALMVLGGGLFGLLLARLLPIWLAAPVAVVVVVAWVGILGSSDSWPMLAPLVEWVQYDEGNPGTRVLEPGSFAWHNAYLAGLCGLGVVAAMLREPGSRRGLVLAGSALTAATVTAAVLALP
jgi:hypothetical protein